MGSLAFSSCFAVWRWFSFSSSWPAAAAAGTTTPAGTTIAEPGFAPERPGLEARGHVFGSQNEIGAVTGIEFLGRKRFLAAAEPTRRGGGSAAVVRKDR